MILAVDSETTGLDMIHGCGPFLVTACDGETNYLFRGKVNPYTREIFWDDDEIISLQDTLNRATKLVFHNSNFDIRALTTIGVDFTHLWHKVEDTLLAAHAIHSAKDGKDDSFGSGNVGRSLGLKDLAIEYLDYWNDDELHLETVVREAVISARAKGWRVAKEGDPCFPGAKGAGTSWWKQDYWLCPEEVELYGCKDVERTWLLWDAFKYTLLEDNLFDVYNTRKKLLPIVYDMMTVGKYFYSIEAQTEITSLKEQMEAVRWEIKTLAGITYRFDPNKRDHLIDLIHHRCNIPIKYTTPGSSEEGPVTPSMDKKALDAYEQQYDVEAIRKLASYRKMMSRVIHIESYLRWTDQHSRIHSSINITGTRETRQSSSSPNIQNIDKSLVNLFGPPPGKVWLCIDLVNIELRIWAYETGNKELIEAFERGESVHLLITQVLAPLFIKQGSNQQKADIALFTSGCTGKYINQDSPAISAFKKTKTYTDIKSGTFAWIYGGTDRKVNQTYFSTNSDTPPRCTDAIGKRFKGVVEFIKSVPRQIEQNLLLYNVPAIHCRGGYRLDVPLDQTYIGSNYIIQGTAGWITTLGMIAVKSNLDYIKYGCQMISQVHDSLEIEIPITVPTMQQLLANTQLSPHNPALYLPRIIDSITMAIEDAGRTIIPTCTVSYEIMYHETDESNEHLVNAGFGVAF